MDAWCQKYPSDAARRFTPSDFAQNSHRVACILREGNFRERKLYFNKCKQLADTVRRTENHTPKDASGAQSFIRVSDGGAADI